MRCRRRSAWWTSRCAAAGRCSARCCDPIAAGSLAPALAALPPPWILAAVPALADYLVRERPDALLSALSYSNLAALWARERAGVAVRVVISERNTLSVRSAHARGLQWRVLPKVEARWYPRADAILAVSEGVADDLARTARLARDRITVTYNPVDTAAVEAAAREPVAHEWLRPGELPIVLGVGKLKPQKGFDVLLRAFARVRAVRAARLVILGEGPQRRPLERLARELGLGSGDLALPGFVANPYAWMARSAVFALSSRWEGLPNALIEALACGCAVVSSDCPSGPAEILGAGRLGALVPVDDADALAAAIGRALTPSDPTARRARARDFAIERIAPRYLAALLPETTLDTNAASRSAIGE